MRIDVSHTEPKSLHLLATSSAHINTIPELFGCDFLLTHPETNFQAGIQRKKFPDDFIASLKTRLPEQLGKIQRLENRIFILEGYPQFTSDGKLIKPGYGQTITLSAFQSMIFSIQFIFGCSVFWTRNETETGLFIQNYVRWLSASDHNSLLSRGKLKKGSHLHLWRLYMLQSWPGIGIGKAEAILQHFNGLPFSLLEDLSAVEGIGKDLNAAVHKVFEREK